MDEHQEKSYADTVKSGGSWSFPVSNYQGKDELIERLEKDKVDYAVRYDSVSGWQVMVPHPDKRRQR